MVRSMYSGVSGLRSHQTRMDTIGNNIANVNTYGFKSGRTTFRDIYYQSLRNASSPSAAMGGMNPSAVGYGTQVGSVDVMMGQSTFSMTDYSMDVAIDGDGFVQVEDADGNRYYTRAGMLNFDSSGNLVDMQGNYVLGVNGDPTGKAGSSNRISVTLPAVPPTAASITQELNGLQYTISASNTTVDGNVSMNFTTDPTLPDGMMKASISSTGIVVSMHPDTTFSDLDAFNQMMNDAVTNANNGVPHVAGNFTLAYTGDPALNPFLTGTDVKASDFVSSDYSIQLGSLKYGTTAATATGGVSPNGTVGSAFGNNWTPAGSTEEPAGDLTWMYAAGPPAAYTFTQIIGGVTYTGATDANKTSSGTFLMKNTADANDYFVMSRPGFAALDGELGGAGAGTGTVTAAALGDGTTAPTATASQPSKALGFSSMAFPLRGGTLGGEQTIADMTGIYISPNGIITGTDSVGTEIIIGRIDLATFANPAGLNQAGSTTFAVSQNSGAAQVTQPGTNGAGQLVSGTLELSNVDLSKEFSDMITTQRGYQANSRIITVSDTMLEELINLKR